MRVRAMEAATTKSSGDNQRSTSRPRRPSEADRTHRDRCTDACTATRMAAMACAVGLASACGATPEKVAHVEAPAPSATSATPSPVAEASPPNAPSSTPKASPASPTPSPPSPSSAYTPALACDVRGAPVLAKGANLYAEPQGTTAVAGFAGQPVTLIATAFPASPSAGRIRVRTSGGLRIDGFVDPQDLPLYTASEIGIVQGHLWLAQGQRVAFSAASNGLTVAAAVSRPVTQ